MVNIQKLAYLTGIHLWADEQDKLGLQIESVVSLLEKVKHYDIPTPTQSWHEVIGLHTIPSQEQIVDGSSDAILANVAHPLVGHAVEMKAFVE